MSALPEIRENAAPPDIAALYADMRAVMGVPLVNLIYRHIATVPNGLAWVWSAVRPHIASGAIGSLAEDVLGRAAATGWGEPSPLGSLPPGERAAIAPIVQWYNRSNAVNLVSLLALRGLPSEPAPRGDEDVTAASRTPPAALPPPLALGDVAANLRDRIANVCERQGLSADGVTPTMYLHLARWPAALATILACVERAIDSGVFERGVASVTAAADSAVRELGPPLVASEAPPDAAGRAVILAAIETFSSKAIPQMLTVGTFLGGLYDRGEPLRQY